MKNLYIISLSLALLCGGLKLNYEPNHNSLTNGLQTYWLKKTKKEVLRDSTGNNLVYTAISNSLHFICSGLSLKTFPF